jgi:predicted nucleotidyltransferase component of viral defense system
LDERPEKILTPLQIKTLDAFFAEAEFARVFYLTGGTALAAFYLFHRYSDDLDFFTHENQIEFLWPMLQKLKPSSAFEVVSRTPSYIRIQFTEGLRVDFVQDIPYRVGVPIQRGAWRVDCLENLILNKISAIQGRLDMKDYVDLYFLLKDKPQDILKYLGEAKQKDTSIDPFVWSRVILDMENLRVMPRMILPIKHEELVDFYSGLRKKILVSLKK